MAERSLIRLLSDPKRNMMQSATNEKQPWALPVNKTLPIGKDCSASMARKEQSPDMQSVATEALTATTTETTNTNQSSLFQSSATNIAEVTRIDENELGEDDRMESHSLPCDLGNSRVHVSDEDEHESSIEKAVQLTSGIGITAKDGMAPFTESRAPVRTLSIDSLAFSELMDWTIDSNINSLVDSLATFAQDSDEVFCLLPASTNAKKAAATANEQPSKPNLVRKGKRPLSQHMQCDTSEAASLTMDIKEFSPTVNEQRSGAPMYVPMRRGSLVQRSSPPAETVQGTTSTAAPRRTLSYRMRDLGITPRDLLDYIPREALQQALDRYRAEAKLKGMVVASAIKAVHSVPGSGENGTSSEGDMQGTRASGSVQTLMMSEYKEASERGDMETSSNDDDSIKVFVNPNHSRWEAQINDCHSSSSLHFMQVDFCSRSVASAVPKVDQPCRHTQELPPERPCRRGSIVGAAERAGDGSTQSVPSKEVGEMDLDIRPGTALPTFELIDVSDRPKSTPLPIHQCLPVSDSPESSASRSSSRESLLQRHLEGPLASHRIRQLSGSKSISSRHSKRACSKSLCSEATSKVSNRNANLRRQKTVDVISSRNAGLQKKALSTILDREVAAKVSSAGRGGRSVKSVADKSVTSHKSSKSTKSGRKPVSGARLAANKKAPCRSTNEDAVATSTNPATGQTIAAAPVGRAYTRPRQTEILTSSSDDALHTRKKIQSLVTPVAKNDSVQSLDHHGRKTRTPAAASKVDVPRALKEQTCDKITKGSGAATKSKAVTRGRLAASILSPSGGSRSCSAPQKISTASGRSQSLPRSKHQLCDDVRLRHPIVQSSCSSVVVQEQRMAKNSGPNMLKAIKDAFRKGSHLANAASKRDLPSSNDSSTCPRLENTGYTALQQSPMVTSSQCVAIRLKTPLMLSTGETTPARRSLSQSRIGGSQRSLNSQSVFSLEQSQRSLASSKTIPSKNRVVTKLRAAVSNAPRPEELRATLYLRTAQHSAMFDQSVNDELRIAGISDDQLAALARHGLTIQRAPVSDG